MARVSTVARAGKFRMTVDQGLIERDVQHIVSGVDAIAHTMQQTGTGEVVVSKRKKLPHERGTHYKQNKETGELEPYTLKVLHGKAIANILRKKGYDPFGNGLPMRRAEQLLKAWNAEINEALAEAYRTRTSQRQRIIKANRTIAKRMAKLVRQNIERGGLGDNDDASYNRYQAWVLRQRGITHRYNLHRGIFTGRFIEGIRARWRRGRGGG